MTGQSVALLSSALLLVIGTSTSAGTNGDRRSSSVAVTSDGRVVVVNPDSNSISLVAFQDGSPSVTEIPVGRRPGTLAVGGSEAWVTNRDEATVAVVSLDEARVSACYEVGPDPFGVVVGESRVYVASEAGAIISVFDAATHGRLGGIRVDGRPRGLALTADGSTLYATHFQDGRLSVVDTALQVESAKLATSVNANLSQAVALDEPNSRAYLPQTLTNHLSTALVFDATVFPVVSVVDTASLSHLRPQRIALDTADRPVGQPLDALVHPSGKLYVANAASNDISVIDLASGAGVAHIEVGAGPQGLALSGDGSQLYVQNSLDGSLSVIETATDTRIADVVLSTIPMPPSLLNGKRLFHTSDDPRMARDQWIACSTCHFDGEADGRTWFFPDGPRNTPSLRGSGATLPSHWSGDLDELQDVEQTIRRIQAGTGLVKGADNCSPSCDLAAPNSGRSHDLDDLAAWMASLAPRTQPPLSAAEAAAASRGALLFAAAETGCVDCHPPPLYTDGLRHDVGTGDSPAERKGSLFNTPSLLGLAGTAPYLHDGRADTLTAVLTDANAADLHGRTSQLSAEEVQELATFLRSLPQRDAASDPAVESRCGLPGPRVFASGFESPGDSSAPSLLAARPNRAVADFVP